MINNNITFNKAVSNVEHFIEVVKGKRRIDKSEFGFTCFANSVKVLQQYANNEFTVPTKAKQAKELLNKI